jgi:hypothetical protein
MPQSLRHPMNVLQQQLRLKRRSICVSECLPAVIACDKRKAFAQGSVATKQSTPSWWRDGLLRFARNDER